MQVQRAFGDLRPPGEIGRHAIVARHAFLDFGHALHDAEFGGERGESGAAGTQFDAGGQGAALHAAEGEAEVQAVDFAVVYVQVAATVEMAGQFIEGIARCFETEAAAPQAGQGLALEAVPQQGGDIDLVGGDRAAKVEAGPAFGDDGARPDLAGIGRGFGQREVEAAVLENRRQGGGLRLKIAEADVVGRQAQIEIGGGEMRGGEGVVAPLPAGRSAPASPRSTARD